MPRNTNNLSGSIVSSISPKAVIAAVLLIAMTGLWLRVFLRGRSGPAAAQAQNARNAQAAQSESRTIMGMEESKKLRPVALPVVPGRHDQLQIDPFVFDPVQWAHAADHASPDSPELSNADAAEQKHWANLQRISKRLVLEAVVKDADGVPINACVDGKVLSKGSTLKVKENGEIYELKVVEVCETEIKLAWQVFALTVKMPSSEWLD